MRVFSQAIVFVVSLLFGDSFIHAQITNDASGHWEGSLTMPFGELRFELDLAPDGPGQAGPGPSAFPIRSSRDFPFRR